MQLTTETLLAEIRGANQRLADQAVVDPKKELVHNVYPLIELLAQVYNEQFTDVHERLDLAEGAVAEYLTQQESMVLPDLAETLQTVFALALKLCAEVVQEPQPATVPKLAATCRDRIVKAQQLVADVTLVEEPDDDDGDDDDDDDNDDDDAGDATPAAAEATKESLL
jgi:hypothetical protein